MCYLPVCIVSVSRFVIFLRSGEEEGQVVLDLYETDNLSFAFALADLFGAIRDYFTEKSVSDLDDLIESIPQVQRNEKNRGFGTMNGAGAVPLQVLLDLLSRHPAIVLGPRATIVPGDWDAVIQSEFQSIPKESLSSPPTAENLGRLLDELSNKDQPSAERVKRAIRTKLTSLSQSLDLNHIVRGGLVSVYLIDVRSHIRELHK